MLLLRYPLVLQARAVSYEGECTYFLRHFAPRLPQGYEWFCVEYKFSPLWSQSRGTTKKNGFFFSNQNESMLKGTKPKCIICQNMMTNMSEYDDVTIHKILRRCHLNRKVPLYRMSVQKHHSRHQNVVRTSVTHSAVLRMPLFFYLPFFDLICVLLLNRSTATWNIFVYPLALKSD